MIEIEWWVRSGEHQGLDEDLTDPKRPVIWEGIDGVMGQVCSNFKCTGLEGGLDLDCLL